MESLHINDQCLLEHESLKHFQTLKAPQFVKGNLGALLWMPVAPDTWTDHTFLAKPWDRTSKDGMGFNMHS